MRVHYVPKKYASIVTVFKRYCVPWGYLFFFLNFCLQRKDLFRIFSIVSLGNVYKYPKQFKLPNRYLTQLNTLTLIKNLLSPRFKVKSRHPIFKANTFKISTLPVAVCYAAGKDYAKAKVEAAK